MNQEQNNNQNSNSKQQNKPILSIIIVTIFIIIGFGAIIIGINIKDTNNLENNLQQETQKETNKTSSPYTIIINNISYNFPLNYNEFISEKWILKSPDPLEEKIIRSNKDANISFSTDGIPLLAARFVNYSQTQQPAQKCLIIGVGNYLSVSEQFLYKITPGSIKIKNNNNNKEIVIGKTALEEASNILGKPSSENIDATPSNKKFESSFWLDDSGNYLLELLTEPGGNNTIEYFSFFNTKK